MELAAVKRSNGLPGSFIADELQTFFQKTTRAGVARLRCIRSLGVSPMTSCLNALFIKEKPSVAVYAGRDADTRISNGAQTWVSLLRLTSQKSMRLRELDADELTVRINTMITCMPKTRKAPQAILAAAATKRHLRVIDLTAKATVRGNERYEALLSK